MDVYKYGTEVVTKFGNIQAMITAILIRFEKVQYEISYFVNGERKEVWIDEREFSVNTKQIQQIGFRKEFS